MCRVELLLLQTTKFRGEYRERRRMKRNEKLLLYAA
jgi:hypothetical protein